jgi:hypothetical protein
LDWILGDEDGGDGRLDESRLAISHALPTTGHAAQYGQNLKL